MLVNNVRKRKKKKLSFAPGAGLVKRNLSMLFKINPLASVVLLAGIVIFIFIIIYISHTLSLRNLDIPLIENGDTVDNYLFSYATLDFDGKGSGDVGAISVSLTPVVKTLTYIVKRGDTLSEIARVYNLDVGTLISFNKIDNVRRIMAGTILKIPDIDGIPYTVKRGDTLEMISKRYKVPLNAILDANDLVSEIIEPGKSIFIPGARISEFEYKKATGTLFIYPTRGRLSSPFGYRIDPFTGTRRMHYGIDLANRVGTPVRSTMAGTVVVVANHPQGYGKYIVIRHARGYQSLYGHLNTILVRKGQRVSQGQKIGLMGSSGRSTGPHLHFSLYKNYVPVNPLSGYLYR